MSCRPRTCLLIIVMLVASTSAHAQTTADIIRDRVKTGQRVRVTNDQGEELTGKIGTFTADSLGLITTGRASYLFVSYERIISIYRPSSSVRSGALIGMGIGAGLGGAFGVGFVSGCGGRDGFLGCQDEGASTLRAAAVMGVLGGLIGSGIGTVIGGVARKPEDVYHRTPRVSVAPILGRGRRAATVSVRW